MPRALSENILNTVQRKLGLLVVGESGAGKTTVVRQLRMDRMPQGVAFPPRFVSRPVRSDDDPSENISVTVEAFDSLEKSDQFFISWAKRLTASRFERYGFLNRDIKAPCVLSANNALLVDRDTIRPSVDLLGRFVIVEIFSRLESRKDRLLRRSPQLLHDPDALNYRLGDRSSQIADLVEFRIENVDEHLEQAVADLGAILSTIGG